MILAAGPEPDGLTLPSGFHATVVAEGLGAIRHLAVRGNGNIYVSTPQDQNGKGGGIIALHLDASHQADQTEHFGTVDGGTGIRFSRRGALREHAVGRLSLHVRGNELVPVKANRSSIVDGMPASHPGFNRVNRPIAFDGKGNLFVALDASANLCTEQTQPPPGQPLPATPPVGAEAAVRISPPVPACGGSSATRPGRNFPPTASSWRPASATSIRSTGRRPTGHLYGDHARPRQHAPTLAGSRQRRRRKSHSPTRCTGSRRPPISAGRTRTTTV